MKREDRIAKARQMGAERAPKRAKENTDEAEAPAERDVPELRGLMAL